MQQAGFEQAITGTFTLLLVDFLRGLQERALSSSRPFARYGESEDIRVQHAVRFIEMNIKSINSIKDVADSVFLSERQLTRVFHKILSASPLQIINLIRINTAMQIRKRSADSDKILESMHGFPIIVAWLSIKTNTFRNSKQRWQNSWRRLPNSNAAWE